MNSVKGKTFFIWGLGLLGTSLALDLKKHGARVLGNTASKEDIPFLNQLGIETFFFNDIASAQKVIKNCQGVILATPATEIVNIVQMLLDMDLPTDVWISDVASSKKELIKMIEQQDQFFNFIGSHPMAGSDLSGPQNAYPEMFAKATIFIVPAQKMIEKFPQQKLHYSKSKQAVIDFWQTLGGFPFEVSYETHDQWAAYLSHGLHLVSCMIPILINDIPQVFEMEHGAAGGSFRDISRVSGSNPNLWQDIISSNRQEVIHYLERLSALSLQWRDDLANNSLDIAHLFEQAAIIRKKLVEVNDHVNNTR